MMDIFARIGGLNRPAEAYPATDQSGGPELTKQTLHPASACCICRMQMRIGAVRFRRCVTVRISPRDSTFWSGRS